MFALKLELNWQSKSWEEFQQIEDLFHSHIATDSKLNLSTNQN